MARVTRVFLDLSLRGADSTTKVETDSIMHMEEWRPRVQSMKKKRVFHSWGRGKVLTWKSFIQPSFSMSATRKIITTKTSTTKH